jgi:hypothetical protein
MASAVFLMFVAVRFLGAGGFTDGNKQSISYQLKKIFRKCMSLLVFYKTSCTCTWCHSFNVVKPTTKDKETVNKLVES